MTMKTAEPKEVVAEGLPLISDRVRRLREHLLDSPVRVCPERSHIVTEYYKRSDGEPALVRRAKAFREVLRKITITISEDDLIAGDFTPYGRGCFFYPEYSYRWLKDELHTLSTREIDRRILAKEDEEGMLKDTEYWEGKALEDIRATLWRDMFGTRIDESIAAKVVIEHMTRPTGRRNLDYPKVLNKGLKGVIAEAQEEIAKLSVFSYDDLRKREFLQAAIITCEALIEFARRYAALAGELAEREGNPVRKRELKTLSEVCSRVPEHPAQSFYEALQSFWLVHLAAEIESAASGFSPGRFDQYVYPFYKADLEKGVLTREQALELLGCLWVKFNQIHKFECLLFAQSGLTSLYQNITIGGQTGEGKDATNDLSYLILDVTEQVRLPQPTISLRYWDGLQERFLLRAAQLVSRGGGMPAWFNDKYALAALPYYGLSLKEARDWRPIGCVEMGLSASTPLFYGFGFYSVAKCLELALSNGFDPRTKKQVGPATGDPRQFKTYDELYDAVKGQLAYAIETAVLHTNTSLALHAELVPVPFSSALMDDCIQRGKDITEGGGRYNNFIIMQPHGYVNTANSLYAMKKLVFQNKAVTISELLDALAANFEGAEDLREKLESAPKYGNDVDEVDLVASDLYQYTINKAMKHKGPFGDPVGTAFLGIGMHYVFGSAVGATPDGRKAYTPTADASLSAYPGTDVRGPTAVVKSAAKVDAFPALSTLFNLKFHPSALKGREGLKKLLALIKTYFDLYGYHIQFNVVSRETLLDAKKNPHLYRDLLVRVAGFTVFWVDLPPAVQDEIIARTEHEL